MRRVATIVTWLVLALVGAGLAWVFAWRPLPAPVHTVGYRDHQGGWNTFERELGPTTTEDCRLLAEVLARRYRQVLHRAPVRPAFDGGLTCDWPRYGLPPLRQALDHEEPVFRLHLPRYSRLRTRAVVVVAWGSPYAGESQTCSFLRSPGGWIFAGCRADSGEM